MASYSGTSLIAALILARTALYASSSTFSGQLNIPEQFFIGVKPFLGGDGFCIPARFRYRIAEGRLVMWFELIRPEKVLEEAYNAVRAKIKAAINEVPLYEATR